MRRDLAHDPHQHVRLDFTVAERDDRLAEIEREKVLRDPGFGKTFTDHMVTAVWTPEEGWHDAARRQYGPLLLDPATAVLHYAQEIFEGLKAYRHADGSVWTFRPRGQRGAVRTLGPPAGAAGAARGTTSSSRIEALVATDVGWVPGRARRRASTCARSCIASEAFLGVRPVRSRSTSCVIASPAGRVLRRRA